MLSPQESAEGVLVTAAIRDISKRKAVEATLRLAERALKSLSKGNAAETDAFNGDELRLLAELAEDLAYGIGALRAPADGVEATQALRKSMEATIAALAATSELHDPYTAGHQFNVSVLSAGIAREMGLSGKGGRYDPVAVDACIAWLRARRFNFSSYPKAQSKPAPVH